ncbi:MAG TPA: dienelactone hydrolase family protein [Pyrinomonadaceae bacterium]|nr:dienelactone hydrolase family protein [Pyrinomonadaceae bacterium]
MSADITPGNERSLAAQTKLYYDLHVPSGEEAQGPRPLLIALHGYGANKRQMMREARLIAPPRFAIASLQGFHQHIKEPKEKGGPLRYGFGWLTSYLPQDSITLHHRAVIDLINILIREGTADGERVFLLGFSQSCALNYRFAFSQTETLRGMIGICGGLPGDWELSEAYGQTRAAVFHLTGERDEFYPPARVLDYAEQLQKRATDVTVKSYDAAHEITEPMRIDVRTWLEEHAR